MVGAGVQQVWLSSLVLLALFAAMRAADRALSGDVKLSSPVAASSRWGSSSQTEEPPATGTSESGTTTSRCGRRSGCPTASGRSPTRRPRASSSRPTATSFSSTRPVRSSGARTPVTPTRAPRPLSSTTRETWCSRQPPTPRPCCGRASTTSGHVAPRREAGAGQGHGRQPGDEVMASARGPSAWAVHAGAAARPARRAAARAAMGRLERAHLRRKHGCGAFGVTDSFGWMT